MTKKTLQLLATAALVAGFGFTTVTANAADTTDTGTASTTAKVTLNPAAVDPDNPGDAGGIKLNSAPNLTFAATTLDGTDKNNIAGTVSGDAEVINGGYKTGWHLTVANTPMATSLETDGTVSAGADIIKGGNYTLVSTGAKSATTDANTTTATSTKSITFNTQAASADAQDVMWADANEGVGTWDAGYSSASMNVPAGNVEGSYVANLNWTLTNAPK